MLILYSNPVCYISRCGASLAETSVAVKLLAVRGLHYTKQVFPYFTLSEDTLGKTNA